LCGGSAAVEDPGPFPFVVGFDHNEQPGAEMVGQRQHGVGRFLGQRDGRDLRGLGQPDRVVGDDRGVVGEWDAGAVHGRG
jgi:hypothetical protein